MKRKWRLQRQFIERQDGQRRWDKAYQLLMEMTAETPVAAAALQNQADVVDKANLSGESL